MKELLTALAAFHAVAERHSLIKAWVTQLHEAKPDKVGVNLSLNWGGSLSGHDLVRKALIGEIEGSYLDMTGAILAKSQAEFDAAEATVRRLLRPTAVEAVAAPAPTLSKDLVAIVYREYFEPDPGTYTITMTQVGFQAMIQDLWRRAHGTPQAAG